MMTDIKTLTRTTNQAHDGSKHWNADAEILATHATLDGSLWSLGLLSSIKAPATKAAINALAKGCRIRNPFFEVPFLNASTHLLGNGKIQFLYLSETIGTCETMRFFAPIVVERHIPFTSKVLKVWSHKYAPLSAPLICAEDETRTVDAFLNALLAVKNHNVKAILFEDLPIDSPLMTRLAGRTDFARKAEQFLPSQRAALNPISVKDYMNKKLSGKRKQRLRRGRERLEALGKVTFEEATTPGHVHEMLEEFLDLEQSGWKGKRKTALKDQPNTADFTSSAIKAMAEQGHCALHTMRLEDKAIASMILFTIAGHYIPWKIAFDERLAQHSAGNQLLVHINQTVLGHPDFKLLDSLAGEENQTANRFWPDRIELCSLAIALGKENTNTITRIRLVSEVTHALRDRAKKMLRR